MTFFFLHIFKIKICILVNSYLKVLLRVLCVMSILFLHFHGRERMQRLTMASMMAPTYVTREPV